MHLSPRAPSLVRLLEKAAAAAAAVELAAPGGSSLAFQVTGWGEDRVRARAVAPTRPADVPPGPVSCVLHLEGRRWAFESVAAPDDEGLTLTTLTRLRPLQRRASPRIAAPADCTLLFALGERVLRRPVVDLSARGLALRLGGGSDEPVAGAVLPEVRFALPIGPPILAAATVRHVRGSADGAHVAGLDLMGLTEADARRLDAWVRGQTRTRRRETAAQNVRVFANTVATLPRARPRPVLDLDTLGVVLGLNDDDRDLESGLMVERLELRHGGGNPFALSARVVEVVTHRGRPLQARLAWEHTRPEEHTRVARLLRALGR